MYDGKVYCSFMVPFTPLNFQPFQVLLCYVRSYMFFPLRILCVDMGVNFLTHWLIVIFLVCVFLHYFMAMVG